MSGWTAPIDQQKEDSKMAFQSQSGLATQCSLCVWERHSSDEPPN